MRHISAWTWWRKTIWGPRDHSGEKNGMPFQISTTPSPVPIRPTAPARRCGGRRCSAGPADDPVAVPPPTRRPPGTADVVMDTSRPAADQADRIRWACSSLPPASGSSWSRQATTSMRRSPAARRSPRGTHRPRAARATRWRGPGPKGGPTRGRGRSPPTSRAVPMSVTVASGRSSGAAAERSRGGAVTAARPRALPRLLHRRSVPEPPRRPRGRAAGSAPGSSPAASRSVATSAGPGDGGGWPRRPPPCPWRGAPGPRGRPRPWPTGGRRPG